MEEMTLYEQLKALRQCTVLVGVHGSGLNNAILLPHDAVLVQLLPYKLNYKGAFQQVTQARASATQTNASQGRCWHGQCGRST